MLIPISAGCSLSDLQQSEQDTFTLCTSNVVVLSRGLVNRMAADPDCAPVKLYSHFSNAERLGTPKKSIMED
jgi:hypothetical protein